MTLTNVNFKGSQASKEYLDASNVELDSQKKIRNMHEDRLLTAAELDELKIIYPGCRNDKALNDYRELRTKLLKLSNNKNFVCMVSSIQSGAGTTHIAINLAASIALDQSKTALIIDCNSHSPSLNKHLKVDSTLGLTDFLEQDTENMEEIIYPSGLSRIRIIPAGCRTENAAEYFSSEKMEIFINMIKQRYPDRFIILDTPPIGLYAESQILTSICDMAILVVRYGTVNSSQVQAGIGLINSDKLAGLIFNDK